MAGKTMRALLLRRHGGLNDLEVVDDYPMPQASDDHVVIRVRQLSYRDLSASEPL